MNREIKFRMWRDGRMQGVHTMYSKTNAEDGPVEPQNFAFSEDEILMQFTGLHDKNGKEIYEGDIVDYKFWNKEGIASIQFENGSFGLSEYDTIFEFDIFKPFTFWDEPEVDCYPFIEIIGNIYSNPELLNKEQ